MGKRLSTLLALLAAMSLLVLACQAPAPAAPAPAEPATIEPAAPPTQVPASTQAPSPATATQPSSPVDETQAEEPPDPIGADPTRPGFTLDGSPSLGDPAAPIVIVDFSDFQ